MSEQPPFDGPPDGTEPRPQSGIRDVDPPPPPPDLLQRYNAKVLDPVTAARLPGQPKIRPTVYVADTLLMAAVEAPDQRDNLLDEVANQLGLQRVVARVDDVDRLARLARLFASTGTPFVRLVQFEPIVQDSQPPVPGEVDVWPLLVALRARASQLRRADLVTGIGLNHLLFAATGPRLGGLPYGGPLDANGLPYGGPLDVPGLAQYGLPGSGGREPVAFVGPEPTPSGSGGRKPVVAVLDSGCGAHPWFADPTIVQRGVSLDGVDAGLTDPATDPEISGDLVGPMDGRLDTHAGHGTFICGLVRQLCPDAKLEVIRVMGSDGVVVNDQFLTALGVLHSRMAAAQQAKQTDGLVDVVVLSLGYYHESSDPPLADPTLAALLEALGALGVIVVAAAGNDATLRPLLPAAFSPHPGGRVPAAERGVVPVVAVGGLNPDGSTIALFSNGGEWVRTWDYGAAVVSTFPTTFDGGATASVRLRDGSGRWRETIDPDDYRGGFGTWSGTSFAAPVLAGRLAQMLRDSGTLDEPGPDAAATRAWSLVSDLTGLVRP